MTAPARSNRRDTIVSLAARLTQAAIGVWLIAAPDVLGYGDPAEANDRIFGPIAGGFAFVAAWEVVRSLRWAVLPVAAWLMVAPLVLWYGDASAVVNSVAAGATLAGLSFVAGRPRQTYGGGWTSLWGPMPESIAADAAGRDDAPATR